MSSWFGSSAASAAPAAPTLTQKEQNLKNAQDAVAKFSWSDYLTSKPEYLAAKDAEKIAQDEVNAEKAVPAAPVAQTGGKRRKSAGGKRKKNTGGKSRKVKKEKK